MCLARLTADRTFGASTAVLLPSAFGCDCRSDRGYRSGSASSGDGWGRAEPGRLQGVREHGDRYAHYDVLAWQALAGEEALS